MFFLSVCEEKCLFLHQIQKSNGIKFEHNVEQKKHIIQRLAEFRY